MRIVFIVAICVFIPSLLWGQDQITGVVFSSEDYQVIEGAHILNVSQQKLTFTSENGYFNLIANIGDTIKISNVSFKSSNFVVQEFDFKMISLHPNVIQLKEVKVTNLPEDENDFKRRLMDLGVLEIDSFIPFGVNAAKPKGRIPKLYNRETDVVFGADENFNPSITVPISYFTKKFSKKHKAKRDYYELKASKEQVFANSEKYNKELVTKLTGLTAKELMDFMEYLDFDYDFLSKSSDYEVVKTILDKFEEYSSK
ncbi:hypothetical protein [uncultured Marivirga sp.]|uniref:hypothetical protein n=1 Tax=uncultured Marivirga sp. TaxID=1123707 RepID=UPI0030EDEE89|tara:strand:+ start:444557 stop:445324 length:768 start_codon:yes stop_codon:yes gene_type:complete